MIPAPPRSSADALHDRNHMKHHLELRPNATKRKIVQGGAQDMKPGQAVCRPLIPRANNEENNYLYLCRLQLATLVLLKYNVYEKT